MSGQDRCEPRLAPAEGARLEALLEQRRAAGRGGMSLDMVHGFLTAVASGPRLILPNEWLPQVVGAAAAADAAELQGLLLALYRDVAHELDHRHFGALVAHRPQPGGDPLPLPYGWCRGYAVGLNLHGEAAVDRAGADPEAVAQLECIARFLAAEAEERLDPPDPEEHRRAAARLAGAAVALYQWWRGDSAARPTVS